MPRYIDADKVIELIRNYGKDAVDQGRKSLDPVDDIVALVQAVDCIPTEDVTKVKRGKWRWCGADRWNDAYECSFCGRFAMDNSDYCPYCGAKMEGE